MSVATFLSEADLFNAPPAPPNKVPCDKFFNKGPIFLTSKSSFTFK